MTEREAKVVRSAFAEVAKDLKLKLCYGERIEKGDLYLAMYNTGPHLLTCKDNNQRGWIVPVEDAYCFDTGDCVKVIEVFSENSEISLDVLC